MLIKVIILRKLCWTFIHMLQKLIYILHVVEKKVISLSFVSNNLKTITSIDQKPLKWYLDIDTGFLVHIFRKYMLHIYIKYGKYILRVYEYTYSSKLLPVLDTTV